MASLILLANLPLATSDPGTTSVYQRMLEDTIRNTTVSKLTLVGIQEAIHNTWAAALDATFIYQYWQLTQHTL